LPSGGGNATFTVKVTNNSVEPVTIKSLVDDIYGTLTGDDDCKVGTVLAPGASCDFSFTEQVSGGGDHTDVVTACANDNESNNACDDDNATVSVAADEVLPEVLARTGPQEIQRAMVTGLGLLGLGMMFIYFGEWTRRRSFSVVLPDTSATAEREDPSNPFNPSYGRIEGGRGHNRTLRRRS